MLVDQIKKTSIQTSIENSEGTEKKPLSTRKLSTQNGRIDIKIPKNSKVFKYLYVDSNGQSKLSKWEQLDNLVEIATEMRDDFAEKIFDDFVFRMSAIFPEKKDKLKRLRALILWQIVWGEKQSQEYYKSLEEI